MKTRNVHRGGTTHRVDRLTSRKAQAALALAVSLWIATGGVASAQNSGGVVQNDFYGIMYRGNNGTSNNNNVVFDTDISSGGGYVPAVYGAHSGVPNETATGNTVTIIGGDQLTQVAGAYLSHSGNANGNHVIISGGTIKGAIYGGYTGGFEGQGSAINNSVTLNGVTLSEAKIYGGYDQNGTGDVVTGNTLNLSGVNTAQSIANFDTVNIKSAVWGTSALTLTGDGIVQHADGTWADIDTRNIAFTGINALPAKGEHTILIKNSMTNYPTANIKSGKFTVGTTLEGTGTASLADGDNDGEADDLIYTVNGAADENGGMTVQEQTHNTVMGASVSMTALSMGNEFVGAATEGLAAPANVGADGVSSFAQMGGGSMRQETGSHVDTHTWNAILALGHQNKKERGTMEYGAFFEYGTGNYTTHADNGLRGDGSARYTGGGLLAKYTTKNSVYVEGSLRAGSVHDDARNVLSDGFGNPYSYDTNAAYMGFHLGVGKEIAVAGGNAVDVYGKYFYNRRNGVSFDAGGHYDLDAVTSSVLRVGARYILKRNKWNFYAGAAYEHEFDGKANGTADGVAIRGADTSGGSFRGEIGATVKPGENSPWNIDLNVSGFAGKKQGFTGGVSVALMF